MLYRLQLRHMAVTAHGEGAQLVDLLGRQPPAVVPWSR
jgi:hypothetical protein